MSDEFSGTGHPQPAVLQVVTLITPDGAYGGPVRVAFNQSRQLRAAGHRTMVAGGVRGYRKIPTALDGIPVRLAKARSIIPMLGFSGMIAPALLGWMVLNRRSFDVIHVHLARDLITLPAAVMALILRKRLVVQTHGMIADSSHPIAPLLDRVLTRPILRRAAAVLYLTVEERVALSRVQPEAAVQHLPNGVPGYDGTSTVGSGDRTSDQVEVLYLARLQSRKRPVLFAKTAARLVAEGCDARFTLVGPDEGEAAQVLETIMRSGTRTDEIRWEGALPPDRTVARMAAASIYVLPSVDEPFPMSVLEAMSVGLPVVITESCGLAETVRASGSGMVVDESEDSLIEAIRMLITDQRLREQMSAAARQTAAAAFSMEAVARDLTAVYDGRRPVANSWARAES
ncbi:glycosyltransferase [Mycobacterium sp. DL440]|uniref:glycosyltransferase n=1 Tax=Mycobacterium sp. DL440 TaxID=2675523 RepID=UPI00142244DC|nr:glycosyltransferase [Mycobacterium sp. DL440]